MLPISRLSDLRALLADLPQPDVAAMAAARARDAVLTKPPGALGRLEGLAEWLAGWRGKVALDRVQGAIFAGNHGVAARGVSGPAADHLAGRRTGEDAPASRASYLRSRS